MDDSLFQKTSWLTNVKQGTRPEIQAMANTLWVSRAGATLVADVTHVALGSPVAMASLCHSPRVHVTGPAAATH